MEIAIGATLQIEIQGAWTTEEMAKLLKYLDDIYSLYLVQELIDQSRDLPEVPGYLGSSSMDWLEFNQGLLPDEILRISRIRYASPGITDLAGLGLIIEKIVDFLGKIMDLIATSGQRKIDIERAQVEIESERHRLLREQKDDEHKSALREIEIEQRLVELQKEKQNLEIERQKSDAELNKNRLDNIEQMLRIADNADFTEEEQRRLKEGLLLRHAFFENRIQNRQFTDATVLGE